jgi:hypothetical protein
VRRFEVRKVSSILLAVSLVLSTPGAGHAKGMEGETLSFEIQEKISELKEIKKELKEVRSSFDGNFKKICGMYFLNHLTLPLIKTDSFVKFDSFLKDYGKLDSKNAIKQFPVLYDKACAIFTPTWIFSYTINTIIPLIYMSVNGVMTMYNVTKSYSRAQKVLDSLLEKENDEKIGFQFMNSKKLVKEAYKSYWWRKALFLVAKIPLAIADGINAFLPIPDIIKDIFKSIMWRSFIYFIYTRPVLNKMIAAEKTIKKTIKFLEAEAQSI